MKNAYQLYNIMQINSSAKVLKQKKKENYYKQLFCLKTCSDSKINKYGSALLYNGKKGCVIIELHRI